MIEHVRLVVSLLTEIKLKVKEGTHKTCARQIEGVNWMMPVCVAGTCVPFGNATE
jgi:hypothetical protein